VRAEGLNFRGPEHGSELLLRCVASFFPEKLEKKKKIPGLGISWNV